MERGDEDSDENQTLEQTDDDIDARDFSFVGFSGYIHDSENLRKPELKRRKREQSPSASVDVPETINDIALEDEEKEIWEDDSGSLESDILGEVVDEENLEDLSDQNGNFDDILEEAIDGEGDGQFDDDADADADEEGFSDNTAED